MSQITTWDEFPTVEYVKGVYRQTVSGEKVMMTRIVYRDGVVIPEHSHEAEQVMLVERGRLWAKVGDEEKEVGPGSLLVIPSNWIHSFRQLGDEDVVFYEAFAPIRVVGAAVVLTGVLLAQFATPSESRPVVLEEP